MDWYKRYLADYAADTARLSVTEHGVYNLMLDEFYKSETPLPAARVEVYRLCRAMQDVEQVAVDNVLAQKWVLTEEGWINKKAVKVIGEFRAVSARNKQNAITREEGKRQERARNEHQTGTTSSTKPAPNGHDKGHQTGTKKQLESEDQKIRRSEDQNQNLEGTNTRALGSAKAVNKSGITQSEALAELEVINAELSINPDDEGLKVRKGLMQELINDRGDANG